MNLVKLIMLFMILAPSQLLMAQSKSGTVTIRQSDNIEGYWTFHSLDTSNCNQDDSSTYYHSNHTLNLTSEGSFEFQEFNVKSSGKYRMTSDSLLLYVDTPGKFTLGLRIIKLSKNYLIITQSIVECYEEMRFIKVD